MTEQWADIPLADDARTPPPSVESGKYVKVGLTSDHLLFVWAAGPTRAYRTAAQISEQSSIRATWTDSETGERMSQLRPFTSDDQETIDEFVNFGLERAGLPSYPSEYDWFVKVPDYITDAENLANALKAQHSARDDVHALLRCGRVRFEKQRVIRSWIAAELLTERLPLRREGVVDLRPADRIVIPRQCPPAISIAAPLHERAIADASKNQRGVPLTRDSLLTEALAPLFDFPRAFVACRGAFRSHACTVSNIGSHVPTSPTVVAQLLPRPDRQGASYQPT